MVMNPTICPSCESSPGPPVVVRFCGGCGTRLPLTSGDEHWVRIARFVHLADAGYYADLMTAFDVPTRVMEDHEAAHFGQSSVRHVLAVPETRVSEAMAVLESDDSDGRSAEADVDAQLFASKLAAQAEPRERSGRDPFNEPGIDEAYLRRRAAERAIFGPPPSTPRDSAAPSPLRQFAGPFVIGLIGGGLLFAAVRPNAWRAVGRPLARPAPAAVETHLSDILQRGGEGWISVGADGVTRELFWDEATSRLRLREDRTGDGRWDEVRSIPIAIR